ncbi:hypothetical protein Aph01nite_19820 [Acrocarpospora phusangensis]|uniref:Uncharacterized protein n=1 Tax=Acrocarpospora phusangensis TaxID=1070424 RepID=A0A919UMS0_9ACTN|nr:hypothetical protein [Acrocarpospora phusangensis]GIH23672.1 hypothetical protein Aph01nite_19820 [Acrocarpospora phusangensis]
MHLAHYLGLLYHAECALERAYLEVAHAHCAEPDVHYLCYTFAGQCSAHARRLGPLAARYGEQAPVECERLHSNLFSGSRTGGLALLRDLHDLYLMAAECDISWTLVGQAAQGARDQELLTVVRESEGESAIQLLWLRNRLRQAAPQTLVVAS